MLQVHGGCCWQAVAFVSKAKVRKEGFSKDRVRDVYLQAFSREEKCQGITRKTLSAYLNGWVTEIPKDLENILI